MLNVTMFKLVVREIIKYLGVLVQDLHPDHLRSVPTYRQEWQMAVTPGIRKIKHVNTCHQITVTPTPYANTQSVGKVVCPVLDPINQDQDQDLATIVQRVVLVCALHVLVKRALAVKSVTSIRKRVEIIAS